MNFFFLNETVGVQKYLPNFPNQHEIIYLYIICRRDNSYCSWSFIPSSSHLWWSDIDIQYIL